MVLALTCAVQNYDWGVVGDSEVSSLGEANAGVASDATKPHAELWMGTHPSGPSVVVGTGAGLKETIASDARAHLGERVLERFGPDLPFLTKVLSVAKALSIQAHPDKKLAAKLHASNPAAYKDDNHKPEMTLAVTPFEALCGFVCHNDMAKNLTEVPELAAVAGEAAEDFLGYMPNSVGWVPAASRRRIKGVFAAVMRAEKPEIEHAVETLQKRLSAVDPATLRDVDALALRLCEQYPKDVGVLCAYLLNYVKLEPDECIYLAANEPHAYLAGTCIECMATSDNVVRAGLTPKLRDVDVLVEMLTYACGPTKILRGDVVDEKTRRYVPPFDEFQLETINLGPNDVYDVAVSKGPCVYLVREGGGTVNGTTGTEAMEAKRGGVFFSSAGEAVRFAASAEGMRAHRAMINDWVFSDVPRPPKWKENDVEGWRAYEHGRREDDDEYA